jgi:gluconate kinase
VSRKICNCVSLYQAIRNIHQSRQLTFFPHYLIDSEFSRLSKVKSEKVEIFIDSIISWEKMYATYSNGLD